MLQENDQISWYFVKLNPKKEVQHSEPIYLFLIPRATKTWNLQKGDPQKERWEPTKVAFVSLLMWNRKKEIQSPIVRRGSKILDSTRNGLTNADENRRRVIIESLFYFNQNRRTDFSEKNGFRESLAWKKGDLRHPLYGNVNVKHSRTRNTIAIKRRDNTLLADKKGWNVLKFVLNSLSFEQEKDTGPIGWPWNGQAVLMICLNRLLSTIYLLQSVFRLPFRFASVWLIAKRTTKNRHLKTGRRCWPRFVAFVLSKLGQRMESRGRICPEQFKAVGYSTMTAQCAVKGKGKGRVGACNRNDDAKRQSEKLIQNFFHHFYLKHFKTFAVRPTLATCMIIFSATTNKKDG